jgi:ABC-2 type transport system ATP-binding protein/lipopolysaccharide transport system ATP-binding protein
MASISIDNASVSYFLRKQNGNKRSLERAAVGAQIVEGRRYLEVAALRDVSLQFRQGDRVGLIGINGSGKSTLLRLCAGALATNKGTISIEGKVSPQFSLGAGIRANLSGRRNTELKCLYMRTPLRAIAARVEEIKELSGLGGYFELPVSSYSAGMRSRLVMSMLRLVRAEILVMDEWIGAADATVNAKIGALQADLIGQASIVILASHSERVLKDWTNQLVWLDQGVIKNVGPTEEIFEEYQKWLDVR